MTDEKLIKEFTRWVLVGKPSVWVKQDGDTVWYTKHTTYQNSSKVTYIVDDEHARFRKLQVDEPDTKFQAFDTKEKDWYDCDPTWDIGCKYRVKPKEWYEGPNVIGKPLWVWDAEEEPDIDLFIEYVNNSEYPFKCKNGSWKQAKPVKPEDLYQGVNDD